MEKETEERVHKFFVDSQQQATIRCPKCGLAKTIDAAKFKATAKRLKVTCKCGETFRGEVEFRRNYRKTVRLPGRYVHLNSPKRGEMLVEDLSMSGLGFTSNRDHGLKVGDFLEVNFKLDKGPRSEIRLKVIIRFVKDRFIGAERTDNLLCNEALGFYLM